jgi:hypothetical protein
MQATMSMESHLPPEAEGSASGLTETDRESRPWPQAGQAWTVLARRTAEVKNTARAGSALIRAGPAED